MAEAVLRTDGLTKRFGDVVAIQDISFSVPAGVVYGFLGPNGAGKTTTIGIVLGLLRATSGNAELFGEPVSPSRVAPLRRVGSLVGEPGMIPHLSGRENLRLLLRLHPDQTTARVEEVLEQVGLRHAAGRKFQGYSMGMKQRLGLAAALLHRPALLVLDEPTNGLDPAGMREIRELLRSLAGEGVTVFLSSHLLHEVQQICDQVAILSRGRLVARGKVGDLLGEQQVVKVRVPSKQEATRLLGALPGVGSIGSDGAYLQVRGIPSEEIVLHLVSNGVVPSEVIQHNGDLESLFFELTSEEA